MNKDLNVIENRDLFIGGSDVASIFGLNKYKSIEQLIESKILPQKKPIHNALIDFGNTMEPLF